jgi:hypothetical protein
VVVVVPMVVMVMPMTVATLVVPTLMVMPTTVVAPHRLFLAGRIGDGLHGHLGDRRAPHERRDGERRDGNAWKLHVFSL